MTAFDYSAHVRARHDDGAPEALVQALHYEWVGFGHMGQDRVGPLDTLNELADAGWRLVRVGDVAPTSREDGAPAGHKSGTEETR